MPIQKFQSQEIDMAVDYAVTLGIVRYRLIFRYNPCYYFSHFDVAFVVLGR